MERRYRKAINFDLDTHLLKAKYPGADYRAAYYDIRRFFERRGYEHRQGSGYLSAQKQTSADIYDLMDDLARELPWLSECVNKIDVTNIGQQHDLLGLLKPGGPALDIPLLLQQPEAASQSTAKAGE